MKKHSLSLVAIAAAALFSIGAQAQAPALNDRAKGFDFNQFYGSKMPADTMVSKQEYMQEMERRWNNAEKMMGTDAKKGWTSYAMLMKSMEQPNVANGGGAK